MTWTLMHVVQYNKVNALKSPARPVSAKDNREVRDLRNQVLNVIGFNRFSLSVTPIVS